MYNVIENALNRLNYKITQYEAAVETGSIIRSHSTRQPLKQENLYGTAMKVINKERIKTYELF